MTSRRLIEIDVTGLTDDDIADVCSHVKSKQEAETYEYQLGSGWRCYHCGEMFRTPGGAAMHFGKPSDKRPVCYADGECLPEEKK